MCLGVDVYESSLGLGFVCILFFFYWGGGKENFMWNARVILLCKAGFLSGAED